MGKCLGAFVRPETDERIKYETTATIRFIMLNLPQEEASRKGIV